MVNIYIKTFLISLGIFSLGLLVGFYIERFLASDIVARTTLIESSVQEIELQMLYFQGLNESYACDFLNEIVRDTNKNLDILADQLLRYSEKNILFTRPEIASLKRRYTSLLIKDWLLQERIKKNCGTKVVTVLYFYSTEECDDCLIQGTILSILKNEFREKLMVFPLDIKVEVSMIDILRKRFNITTTPSLVIEEKTYTGIVSKDDLKSIICDVLKEENLAICS